MNRFFPSATITLLALIVLLVGCTGPVTPGAGDDATAESLGSLVKNIPALRADLSASLSGDTSSAGSSQAQTRSTAWSSPSTSSPRI